ncbi:MAG: alpha-ketoglutarate-dependent dioxygenase AlkB family protein [Gammaproteobacteria bacterium]
MDNLVSGDGELYLAASFYDMAQAEGLFESLMRSLKWEQETIVIGGKVVEVPRLVCWYGDQDAIYSYSGVAHVPLPWTPKLTEIKKRIEHFCGHAFNSVLGNLYRDGSDSMGWHADKEKELGRNPFIASLSLGEERVFKIRHNRSRETLDISLKSGDLLLMGGALQHWWRHCVPKTRRRKLPRINLTFRKIIVPGSE